MESHAADDKCPGTLNIGQNGTGIIGEVITNATYVAQQQVITPEAISLQPFKARSPYKSLKRFDIDDREYFFGRYQFVCQLQEALKSSNLILVAGPSGSGKSSVVRAKLIPDFLGASSERHDFILTPKENPFRSLYESLIGRDKIGPDKDYCFSEAKAHFVLEGTLDVLARVVRELKDKGSEWLIFIDQFEELFTLCTNPEQRKNFIDSLTQIAEAKDRSLKIVLAMSADFMGELSRYRDFWSSVKSQFLLVTDMTEDDLQMAIKGPAAKHGVQFESGLTKKIIEDVLGQPGALPLMQYTLDQLWRYEAKQDELADRILNTENYLSLGGVRGALEKHVEKVFEDLDAAGQKATKDIFLSLVKTRTQDGVSTAVSKSMRRVELRGEAVQKTIDCLINENLLVSNSSESNQPALQCYEGMKSQQATIEVTHEILLSSWQRLKGYIREAGEILRIKDDLENDLFQWNQTKRIDEELLKPSALAKILELQTANAFELQSLPLSTEEEKYIEASERFLKTEQKRDRQRAYIYGVLSVLTLGAGVFGGNQLWAARAAQVEQYAANHRALLTSNPLESVVNGLAAEDTLRGDPGAALQLSETLEQAIQNNHERDSFSIRSDQSGLRSLVALPDDELVSGGVGGTLRRWKDGKAVGARIPTDQGTVWSLVALSDGELVSGGGDGSLKRWSKDGKQIGATITTDQGLVWSLVAMPNDELVSGGTDGSLKRWSKDGKQIGATITTDQGQVRKLVALPNDELISGGTDGSLKRWRKDGKQIGSTITTDQGLVLSLVALPDGVLISGGMDGTLKRWHKDGRQIGTTITTDQGSVLSLVALPDGVLVSGGKDGTLKRWSKDGKLSSMSPTGQGTAWSLVALPDGELISGGRDGTLKRWSMDGSGSLSGFPIKTQQGAVLSLVALPNGELLSAGDHGTVRRWDKDGKQSGPTITTGQDEVTSLVALPDGGLISGGKDGTLKRWSKDGKLIPAATIPTRQEQVYSLVALPNGGLISGGRTAL